MQHPSPDLVLWEDHRIQSKHFHLHNLGVFQQLTITRTRQPTPTPPEIRFFFFRAYENPFMRPHLLLMEEILHHRLHIFETKENNGISTTVPSTGGVFRISGCHQQLLKPLTFWLQGMPRWQLGKVKKGLPWPRSMVFPRGETSPRFRFQREKPGWMDVWWVFQPTISYVKELYKIIQLIANH